MQGRRDRLACALNPDDLAVKSNDPCRSAPFTSGSSAFLLVGVDLVLDLVHNNVANLVVARDVPCFPKL